MICLEYGEVALTSCDGHASVARATGLYRDEHRFVGYCGMPGSLWLIDRCDLDVLPRSGGSEATPEGGS